MNLLRRFWGTRESREYDEDEVRFAPDRMFPPRKHVIPDQPTEWSGTEAETVRSSEPAGPKREAPSLP